MKKTIRRSGFYAIYLLAITVVVISCDKSPQNSLAEKTNGHDPAQTTTYSNPAPAPLSFCSVDTTPVCWKNSQQDLTYLIIKRGSDKNVYVTFKTSGMFFFKQVNLFCGDLNNTPTLLSDFPYKIGFASPFSNSEYTFVIPNMPEKFNVVGYAKVVMKAANGNITSNVKEGWANACSGLRICSVLPLLCKGDLKEASFLPYSSENCFPNLPLPEESGLPVQEPNTCSYLPNCFFGVNPNYNVAIAWPRPTVTVAGYEYTEAEGRAIANTADPSGIEPDSKYALVRVATLKLSNTQWTISPTLAPAVKTIETWLADKGKISPSILPTGNPTVREAAYKIDEWMGLHTCIDRRR